MSEVTTLTYPRRIYPLSAKELSEEQLAVVFAMTSRRPEAFDQIAQQVSQEKAADFHERWVLGYGHASVAEHAVIHMAVENVSRLACDSLEDNRLASYTEKSSRYQMLPPGYYHMPRELDQDSSLKDLYCRTCDHLFATYQQMVESVQDYLRTVRPKNEEERDSGYNLRLRREATDSCRFMLPAATLTNVGVTMNARCMEYAITKLLSSELAEERELGEELKLKGREITPTLIKYAERNKYLTSARSWQQKNPLSPEQTWTEDTIKASLVHYDPQAETKLTAGLLYRFSGLPYDRVWQQTLEMAPEERWKIIGTCLNELGPHDSSLREFELVDYTFELLMDYGAYREFKRHRMQSYIPQPLTVAHGYLVPPLIQQAGLEEPFAKAMQQAEAPYWRLYKAMPAVAPYLVTHAHKRRILTKVNLRECYHLFKLRTQQQAHFSIRQVMDKALRLAVETHPQLFRYLPLRDFPDWWPFPTEVEP